MSKFTPGPWAAAARKGEDWDSVVYVQSNPNLEVCQCFHASQNLAALDRCEATTHLIAAAPEMYEALKGAQIMIGFLLEYAELHRSFTKASKRNANVTLIKIMDALAKADGGQQ